MIEIGCPALHETIADWSLALPNGSDDGTRRWDGQAFVRHVAAGATYAPWRVGGWEHRDTGIGEATGGLAGARVVRATAPSGERVAHASEMALLVVLSGEVTFEPDDGPTTCLRRSSSVAIPGGLGYRLSGATTDCELLDVTLPAQL